MASLMLEIKYARKKKKLHLTKNSFSIVNDMHCEKVVEEYHICKKYRRFLINWIRQNIKQLIFSFLYREIS